VTTVVAAGLTEAEVAQRITDGHTNDVPTRAALVAESGLAYVVIFSVPVAQKTFTMTRPTWRSRRSRWASE
jgi:hypothetical protein